MNSTSIKGFLIIMNGVQKKTICVDALFSTLAKEIQCEVPDPEVMMRNLLFRSLTHKHFMIQSYFYDPNGLKALIQEQDINFMNVLFETYGRLFYEVGLRFDR